MTSVRSSRVFSTLLLVALAGALVQMYRVFLVLPQFQAFALRVVTLFLEALPFLFAAAVLPAVAGEILPTERIVRFCRKRRVLGLPAITLAGFALPIGEIRLPGLARGLRDDGLPVPHLVAALLAIPLINPVVLVATVVAFPMQPELVMLRFLGALLVAISAGALLAAWTPPERENRRDRTAPMTRSVPHTPHPYRRGSPASIREGLERTVQNALAGFLFMTRYFLVAAVLVGLIQSITLPPGLAQLRSAMIPGAILAVGVAYLLSAPAGGDSFIARGLLTVLPVPALTAFLVVGPAFNLRTLPVFAALLKTGHLILLHLVVFSLGVAVALAAALI